MKNLFCLLFAVNIFMLSFPNAEAQEINANVTVNMEQLSFEARNNIASLESVIENYINNQAFTNIEWEGERIPVEISIALSGGGANRYSAKIFVASRRLLDGPDDPPGETTTIKFYEQQWSFEYGMGASMTYNPLRFDELSTTIDYFMLMVIGYDLDTYGELDGTPVFNKARELVRLGAGAGAEGFSVNAQLGDFTKSNLVNELIDMRYDGFRKIVFSYYVNGLDRMGFNKEEAMQAIKLAIADMAEFKKNKVTSASVMMQAFFDTKSREIATIFNGSDDDELFQNLKYLDPSNSSLYDEAREGKL